MEFIASAFLLLRENMGSTIFASTVNGSSKTASIKGGSIDALLSHDPCQSDASVETSLTNNVSTSDLSQTFLNHSIAATKLTGRFLSPTTRITMKTEAVFDASN